MTRRVILVLSILLVVVVGAMAADISGKWVAKVPGRDGQTRDATFMFKMDGDTLTGTMSGGQGGDQAISEGKVSGDTVTFSITTERGKRSYIGKISGSEIKFKREGGQNAQEFTAKRPAS